jgi:5-methylcytosine-specific restriction endonuclease McrA
LRLAVHERDGWTCWLCQLPLDREVPRDHPAYPSVDHLVPRSMGGPYEEGNLRSAHRACNTIRGVRDPRNPGPVELFRAHLEEARERWLAKQAFRAELAGRV